MIIIIIILLYRVLFSILDILNYQENPLNPWKTAYLAL